MLPSRARQENAAMPAPMVPWGSSYFDRSHFHKTSFNYGQLAVTTCQEVMPGDTWRLGIEALLRHPKLFFPIFEQVELHTAFFYVKNTTLWDKWKAFIKPDIDVSADWTTTPTPMPTCDLIFSELANDQGVDLWNKLTVAYMGFPSPINNDFTGERTIKISALPIVAYWKVWNDFYRRPQLQPEFGRSSDQSEEPILRDITDPEGDVTQMLSDYFTEWADAMGGNEWRDDPGIGPTNPFLPHLLNRRNWTPDYFTMGTYEPQYGEDVIIPVFSNDAITLGDLSQATRSWSIATGQIQDAASSVSVHSTGNLRSTGAGAPPEIALDVSGTAGNLRELAYAESMQRFLERINRSGDRHKDLIRTSFGADPSPFNDDYAVFIGARSSVVAITDVYSTSDSRPAENNQLSEGVGSYAGKAIGSMNTGAMSITCNDHGFIIGIINVQPESSYMNGIPKMFIRKDWQDYAWPDFAHIGDQEVEARELVLNYQFPLDDPENTKTWSYVPRYQEWRYQNSITSSEMRRYWTGMHFTRTFDQNQPAPNLSGYFLQCIPDEARVFEIVGGQDATGAGSNTVYAWLWITAEVIRRLPKYGVPKLV